ncbi:uncharacterized protein MELLADRAFT_68187 [Melampsora larici-populina 98AG31]|uniref:Uncharacterized protein n=1 Tax=Melampsora larici-populina (strain 98AG31 / pathotype 3-4-7) TaxID=747676 RepID=F4S5W2_MELLP|nr:uncharacterized protein MELLADRAFT_68187 [Melampsora larici-populina 98AG31]EGF99996.1 hypothetical protein MELLADRAFT_68187 [Melampsora larici-populina 98AG31]
MQYFAEQWTRQKEMQLELIDDENHNEVQEMLERLGELEDDLKIAKTSKTRLRKIRRRTENQRAELHRGEIDVLVEELGEHRFCNISGAGGWDATAGSLPVEVVDPSYDEAWHINRVSKRTWEDCVEILKNTNKGLTYVMCRYWRGWDPLMISLLRGTHQYVDTSEEVDNLLEVTWRELMVSCESRWKEVVPAQTVFAEPGDDGDLQVDFEREEDDF